MRPSARTEDDAAVDAAARRLISQVDLDPYSPTYGCFDRRYWAWKLVDFPEATFQRAVKPLAMLYTSPSSALCGDERVREVIDAGMRFAAHIQHPNGSFDQAFPYEYSFGATAFLLHSIVGAAQLLNQAEMLREEVGDAARACVKRAGLFLCRHDESHGRISNHIAGAVAGLFAADQLLGETRFRERARGLLTRILDSQSVEGWFPEYDGADPSYQTLCMHYLADAQRFERGARLGEALENALDFVAHFAHPDGSFAGEYGARRAAIFYEGGVARLSNTLPLAGTLLAAVQKGIDAGVTPNVEDVDQANVSVLLENRILSIQVGQTKSEDYQLPCDRVPYSRDFQQAKLAVRSTAQYYAVIGIQTGCAIKVVQRNPARCLVDDGGYHASIGRRSYSTQATGQARLIEARHDFLTIEAPFYAVSHTLPSPVRFLVLRFLNLTIMRSIRLGNLAKLLLVRLLITRKSGAKLKVVRQIHFGPSTVRITDVIRGDRRLRLTKLSFGVPFRGIHMASAGYLSSRGHFAHPLRVDVAPFKQAGELFASMLISADCEAEQDLRQRSGEANRA